MDETLRDAASRFARVVEIYEERMNELTWGSGATLDWFRSMQACLLDLYSEALKLPNATPSDVAEEHVPDGSGIDYQKQVASKLGNRDLYWEVFDPPEGEQSPDARLLSDDLADIHRDIDEGLAHYREATADNDAVWTWRFTFEHHWGAHAASAIRAIHHLLIRER